MARVDARATVNEPFDLTVAIAKATAQRRSSSRVAHRVDLPARPVMVMGVADHLTRAIGNLVDNADRHALSRVDVHLRTEDHDAVVEVIDDGKGIPADKRDYVFERFTRLDDARTADDGGSGLGLAIVRDIVTMHGGSIAVLDGVDPPMTGARMVIRLPLETTASVSADPPARPAVAALDSAPSA
jgi:signal transduction histidine kinase